MVILSTFFLKKDIDLNQFNETKLLLNPQRSTTSGTKKSFTLGKELSQKCVARNFLLQKYWNKRFPESARNSRISHFHHKNRTNEINHSIHPSKASHDQFSSSPSFFSPSQNREGLGFFLKNSSTEKSWWPLHGSTPINYTPLLSRCLIKSAEILAFFRPSPSRVIN